MERQIPVAEQVKQKKLFEEGDIRGERLVIEPETSGYRLQYNHPNGQLFQGESITWLKSLEDESVDLPTHVNLLDHSDG